MNLIPEKPGKTPNYWCTWRAQHPQWHIATEEELKAFNYYEATVGGNAARRSMNERVLFDNPGWASRYWPSIRSDLYLCLDDGWDVPADIDAGRERWRFGSLVLNEMRFPGFPGSPSERLRRINDKVKELGWRGVALWVSCQCEGDARDGHETDESRARDYWRERARWSARAGIEYWKVDWGHRQNSVSYRRMMTDAVRQEAPALILEHARCMDPVNNIQGNGRFGDWPTVLTPTLQTYAFSDVLRSYDSMSIATTLDRIAVLLTQGAMEAPAQGIINCEDSAYLGAALGCSIGIMRVPVKNPYTQGKWMKIDEAARAVRWQRIAPAFGPNGTVTKAGDAVLTESWRQKGKHWFEHVSDRRVEQHAPAIISRGIALPLVTSTGQSPYVVASRNPFGACSIAALPRRIEGAPNPPADVVCDIADDCGTIGIFGEYASLRLRCGSAGKIRRIMAQDLLADAAWDITREVTVDKDGIILKGDLINKVGLSAATPDDPSHPGLVVRLER